MQSISQKFRFNKKVQIFLNGNLEDKLSVFMFLIRSVSFIASKFCVIYLFENLFWKRNRNKSAYLCAILDKIMCAYYNTDVY